MKRSDSEDQHITLLIIRAQAKAASEPNIFRKTYGENLVDSNHKLSDSKVHITMDKDKMFTMLKGSDERGRNLLKDLIFHYSLINLNGLIVQH